MEIEISIEEFKAVRSEVQLVDVREPHEHEESRIGGEVLIPLNSLMLEANQKLNPQDKIVLYCAHGIRSRDGAALLKQMGFSHVRSLSGGIAAWNESL